MECDHCDATVDSRREEIDHVLAEHGDDLTSHERDALKRERNDLSAEPGSVTDRIPVGRGTGMAVLFLGLAAVVVYGMVSTGVLSVSAGASSPTGGSAAAPASMGPVGSAHGHARFAVVVDGEPTDFSRPKYQLRSDYVHFEDDSFPDHTIHTHATGVTIRYALQTLGMDLNATCLTLDTGETYCEDPGSLTVTVNGGAVADGAGHVIRDGENIRIDYES